MGISRATRIAFSSVSISLTTMGLVDTAAAQAGALTGNVRREVVDTVASQLERVYVDADTGRMIANRLRDRLRTGAYDTVSDPVRLSQLLTTDLRSVNHDLHLSVAYNSGGAAGGGRAAGPPAFLSKSQHYALGRVDVLPGNIGYMEINGFSGEAGARDAIVGALTYLQTTDAMIIDLRRNRGGDGNLVNFLISHFTGPDTLASVTVKLRAGNRTFTRYTLASVPGPRRPDVPVYVLTSRATGSAGEDCAFVLKNLKRATIIGDRTAGAGHNVTGVSSGYGFQTNISFSRVSDPKTGKEWEQIGVQPDVKVDVATALDVAQSMALKAAVSKADASQRAVLETALQSAEARLNPHDVAAALLGRYAGEYEGGRRVSVAGRALVYESPIGGLSETLIPISDTLFVTPSLTRIQFDVDASGKGRLGTSAGGATTWWRKHSE